MTKRALWERLTDEYGEQHKPLARIVWGFVHNMASAGRDIDGMIEDATNPGQDAENSLRDFLVQLKEEGINFH